MIYSPCRYKLPPKKSAFNKIHDFVIVYLFYDHHWKHPHYHTSLIMEFQYINSVFTAVQYVTISYFPSFYLIHYFDYRHYFDTSKLVYHTYIFLILHVQYNYK